MESPPEENDYKMSSAVGGPAIPSMACSRTASRHALSRCPANYLVQCMKCAKKCQKDEVREGMQKQKYFIAPPEVKCENRHGTRDLCKS